jgi:glycosyltransferase involved in cell wall biosynthesis
MVVTEDWYFLSHRLELAREAARRGLRVTIATGPGERSADIRQAGFEHLVFPLDRRSLNVWREMQTLRALTALMRDLRPSLVHLVAAKPIMYGNIAARLAGGPPVLNAVAGLGYLYMGGGVGRRVLRAAYELTFRTLVRRRSEARVLVQNPDDAQFLLERGMVKPEQLVVITGSGVDIQRFAPSPEPSGTPTVVLMHSRMLWDKGVSELVEAARQLRARGVSNFVVRLAGDPDPHNPASIPLEQLRAWSNEGVVEWIGRSDDIPAELRRCHIACLPSYREGAPLSLLEAAASGRPIVTTDVPGCREVVHHDRNGLLVPVRDARGLADALERLILDGDLRRRLGACGRERAEREYSKEVVNDKIISTYFQMMAERTRP